jgi:hypothetical protein
LDFIIVIEGTITLVARVDAVYLAALKTLRVLRPLRVTNRMPALKRIVNTMIVSLPNILDNVIVYCSVLLIFAILGVVLWEGKFNYRCQDDDGDWYDADNMICYPSPVTSRGFCGGLLFLDAPYACPVGQACRKWVSTPQNGNLNFDNVGFGLLTLFVVVSVMNFVIGGFFF